MIKLKHSLMVSLLISTITLFVVQSYPLASLISAFVTIIFYVEFYVRRPSNKEIGNKNKHLGGGYQSGGKLPGWQIDKNATGAGGVNASGIKKGGAGGGGIFGSNPRG